jgi:UDP-N-acetylmuramate--alanine ligase
VAGDAAPQRLDLSSARSVHVVGLGGAGMSAIATVLAGLGHRVTGSDLRASPTLDRLALLGVTVHVGHAPSNVPADADAVVISTAVPASNPEVVAALGRGVPVLRRAEVLAVLTRMRRTLAVAGTHGKTTTASLVTLILRAAGWRPSFIIGGDVNEVGSNAALDAGEWLVVEADESDGTFLELDADAVVVTNVEPDHLEYYGGFDRLVDGFRRFVAGPEVVVTCADDEVAAALAAPGGAVTYGTAEGAAYRVEGLESSRAGSRFDLHGPGGALGEVRLPVPGRHNALNAAGAAAVCLEMGAPFEAVVSALGRFTGVSRRFEFRGSVGGVTVVDDYAHLPSEVAAAVSAARDGGWDRVLVVFQPHRFSRTEALWRAFGPAFDEADVVVLTDVYPAGEAPRPGVSGRLVLRAVCEDGHPGRVLYVPRRAEIAHHVHNLARPGDVVLTLGAGDVTAVADELLAGVAR